MINSGFMARYPFKIISPVMLAALCLVWLVTIVGLILFTPRQIILLQGERINHEIGCAYTINIKNKPLAWPLTRFEGDNQSFRYSQLSLLENGKPIGIPHAQHETIRVEGFGNYSYWGNQLYFSTPDCTDPRSNGNTYEISMPLSLSFPGLASCFIAAFLFVALIRKQFFSDIEAQRLFAPLSKINFLFFTSCFMVASAILVKFPLLVISPEFYAETAEIFFKEARESTFIEILTYVEADYLVTFPLLISFILVRIFNVIDHFPGTVNFISVLFIAFSVSLINLRSFRGLIDSDLLRFMIGLSVGLMPNQDVYHLLNANLFGFMIYYLFIFVDKNQTGRTLFYLLVGMLFFVGISRPNLVAFFPVYLILLVLAIRKKRVRDIVFYGTGTVSLGLQAYVIIMAQLYWSFRSDLGIYNKVTGLDSLTGPFVVAINRYLNTLLSVLFVQVDGFGTIVVSGIITILMILLACYYLYLRKQLNILYFFCLSQVLAFGLIYFITFSSPVSMTWDQFYYFPMRWWVYSNCVVYISLLVLAYNTVREVLNSGPLTISGGKVRVAMYSFTLLPVIFHIYPFYRYAPSESEYESLSNWANYRFLLHEEDYYIPVNPVQSFQWGISKDNKLIPSVKNFDEKVSGVIIAETKGELKLRSFIIENHHFNNSINSLVVKAYDNMGNELDTPRRLNDFEEKYLYYYFTDRIRPYRLSFFDEELKRVDINLDIHFYGKLDAGESIVISKEL